MRYAPFKSLLYIAKICPFYARFTVILFIINMNDLFKRFNKLVSEKAVEKDCKYITRSFIVPHQALSICISVYAKTREKRNKRIIYFPVASHQVLLFSAKHSVASYQVLSSNNSMSGNAVEKYCCYSKNIPPISPILQLNPLAFQQQEQRQISPKNDFFVECIDQSEAIVIETTLGMIDITLTANGYQYEANGIAEKNIHCLFILLARIVIKNAFAV